MGRRKIEIKAIKDDRNRSVTFLKRKGGLFKKAHELSVLCSVDVAVIIFGQNKKLYEYSSGNINEFLNRYQYYQGPHEHKGPADFAGKGAHDDDDEDDDNIGSPGPEEISPPQHHHEVMPQNYHQQPAFHHVRQHSTPSASPPMPNGVFQKRLSTPQPPQMHSRPASRNQQHVRRPSSNLAPQPHQQQQQQQHQPQVSQPTAAEMEYHYHTNGVYYQALGGSSNQLQVPSQQNSNHMAQQHHYSNPVPMGQVQYMQLQQDNRRQSMPPNFTLSSQERSTQADMNQPPMRPQRPFHSPPLQEQVTVSQATRHSIYTPIDDTRSILAQQWGLTSNHAAQPRNDPSIKLEPGPRSQSIDVGSAMRRTNGTAPQPDFAPPPSVPLRATSVSGIPAFGPPLRQDSMQSDVKRPRLKVQIPSEHSDGGSTTGETGGSSPKKSGTSAGTGSTRAGAAEGPLSSGSAVVLPPPSPSASALLSAGATGPKNPFARPPPPSSSLNNTTLSYRDTETPLSALPSRFMGDVLPSPSQFYPDWNFGNNNLNSPAIYQPTPLAMHGPSFRDDDHHNKRKPDEDVDSAYNKKAKGSGN